MRLVSLCPSITESLVELGLLESLVGVTRYCIHPADALKGVTRVGGTKNPDVPRILGLAPDLVFVNAEENRREDVLAIGASVPVDVSHPRSPEEVPAMLRHFGERTGCGAAAGELAGRLEGRLAQRRRRAAPLRYVALIWKDPWMATGGTAYIDGLLRGAGFVPALPHPDGPDYPELREDEIVAARPDLLLLPDEPFRFGDVHAAFWAERLPGAAVRRVAGDDLCWHGARTFRGLDLTDELVASLPAARG